MSSVIFQPLLHDPLGWKASNSTYSDAFTWKNFRSTGKDKRISPYGQQYQRQLQKQQKLQKSTSSLSSITNEEQTIERISLSKKNEENGGSIPVSQRRSSAKTQPVVSEEPPVFIIEYKQRPASTNKEATCSSRASQHSAPAAEETSPSATTLDVRRSPKEENKKVLIDPNNDTTQHWLTYPNPKTPQYLIDIKQRLGQLKIPTVLSRSISASNIIVERPESSDSHHLQQQSIDKRHLFDFNLPQTPPELRAARHRLEKHRYNPSLDNHPTRPQTCPVRPTENSKPITPPKASESEEEQLPSVETTSKNEDAWTNEEENKPTEHEQSSILIQMVDVDGLPSEYVEAVETANTAQIEYMKNMKTHQENQPENLVYRLPSLTTDQQTQSFIAYRNQQQSTASPTTTTTNRNQFGTWVRNATDKERESAMKILHEVLNQPILGYDIPKKQQTGSKGLSSSRRSKSASRKLGRTRHPHQRIPCEICDKQMIKEHVWNLSRSDTLVCPHQAQGIKPPIIQIRA